MVGWHHQLIGHEFGWTPGVVMDREAWGAAVHGVAKSRLVISGGQSIGVSASASVLPMNIHG